MTGEHGFCAGLAWQYPPRVASHPDCRISHGAFGLENYPIPETPLESGMGAHQLKASAGRAGWTMSLASLQGAWSIARLLSWARLSSALTHLAPWQGRGKQSPRYQRLDTQSLSRHAHDDAS